MGSALGVLLTATLLVPAPSAFAADDMRTCDGHVVTIPGTNGPDVLTGTSARDVIHAGNGDDQVDGLAGDDVICGGNGMDVLEGGDGGDVVLGGHGEDQIDGGRGADRVSGDNGDDVVAGGPGADSASGGRGFDSCVDVENSDATCEESLTTPSQNPLEEAGQAPAGAIPVDGPDGVRLVVDSGGNLNPWDVRITRDEFRTRQVTDALVSPAYDIDLPDDAVVRSALLTLPYRADLLDGFDEEQLRVYHLDDDLGLWVPAEGEHLVDPAADTVTVTVSDFSAYAVFKLDERGFERYWETKEVFCLQEGDAADVGVDAALLIDTSGSMSTYDPTGLRVDGAKAFVAQMRAADRAGVISFSGGATTRIGLTQLDTDADRAAVNSAIDATRFASGGTNISAAVQSGLTMLSSSNVLGRARVMILLTDGESSYSTFLTEAARDAGVVIYTIGLGPGVNATLLQQIAAGTGGRYLALSSADQLPGIYDELGRGLIDDGTDTDTDGLTDCQETYGVLTSYGFYDVALDPTQNDPFLGDRRVTSDPSTPNSDTDSLPDGQEVRGLDLDDPIDLRDYPALVDTYGFLIDAGITDYYVGRSLPEKEDSDGDTVDDDDETFGLRGTDGRTYTSRADRTDTDFDLIRDDLEYRLGTDPRQPDASEVGIAGLAPFTLFQPDRYLSDGVPLIQQSFALYRGTFQVVEYQDYVTFDSDWNCTSNCSALIAASADIEASWCWVPFKAENCSTEEKVRNLVQQAVASQGIFTRTGDFTGSYAADQGVGECLASHAVVADCLDPAMYADTPATVPPDQAQLADGPPNDNLDAAIAEVLLSVAGGYRPRDICQRGAGGVYRLVDNAGVTRYVGQTNDFARRELEHARDARLTGLQFVQEHGTVNRNVRRGLEQQLYNQIWGDVPIADAKSQGSLNLQRPMSRFNPTLRPRLTLANSFLSRCPGLT